MALNTTTTNNTTPTTKDLAAEPWDLVLPLDAQEDVQLSVEPSQTVLLAKLEFAGATRLARRIPSLFQWFLARSLLCDLVEALDRPPKATSRR